MDTENISYNLVCDYTNRDGSVLRKYKPVSGKWSENIDDAWRITTLEDYVEQKKKCGHSGSPAHRRYHLVYVEMPNVDTLAEM